jgi:hypothetical protein
MRIVVGLVLFCLVLPCAFSIAANEIKTENASRDIIASVPRSISYQGVLKNLAGEPIPDTSCDVTFKIFAQESEGSNIWNQLIHVATDVNGAFTAQLANLNLPFDSDYWLQLEVSGIPLLPRQKLAMVPYAAISDTADYAQNSAYSDSAAFARLAGPTPVSGSIYRWAVFNTYMDGTTAWLMNNNPNMYGGIPPNVWTDGNGIAGNMSDDFEVLRTLFTKKGYGGSNATVFSSILLQYSSTNGQVGLVLFRIKNTTSSSITWTPTFCYTCYSGWGEVASAAINGTNVWTSATQNCGGNESIPIPISIPAMQTSTVIFVSTTGFSYNMGSYLYIRPFVLAFKDNTLDLPEGLIYVDDLDTAQ